MIVIPCIPRKLDATNWTTRLIVSNRGKQYVLIDMQRHIARMDLYGRDPSITLLLFLLFPGLRCILARQGTIHLGWNATGPRPKHKARFPFVRRANQSLRGGDG